MAPVLQPCRLQPLTASVRACLHGDTRTEREEVRGHCAVEGRLSHWQCPKRTYSGGVRRRRGANLLAHSPPTWRKGASMLTCAAKIVCCHASPACGPASGLFSKALCSVLDPNLGFHSRPVAGPRPAPPRPAPPRPAPPRPAPPRPAPPRPARRISLPHRQEHILVFSCSLPYLSRVLQLQGGTHGRVPLRYGTGSFPQAKALTHPRQGVFAGATSCALQSVLSFYRIGPSALPPRTHSGIW